MNLAEKIIQFNKQLEIGTQLPVGIEVMNPFRDENVMNLSAAFYRKFYSDNHQRKLILGINPGRFGAGITGIPFTDPVKLQQNCGIHNDLIKSKEPSAGFIYDMIEARDGVKRFYEKYLVHAVCPLGFTKGGVNYNYYDDKNLQKAVTPFIISSVTKFLTMNIDAEFCYCLGNGKNFKYLEELNRKEGFFGKVIPLPHPRWIVQYRRKKYHDFITHYLEILK
ncbi:MAG: DUF4918 family protein [Bacteroidales bacterium]|nr:DUF4918 family protein [Bacteroidales bacterium]